MREAEEIFYITPAGQELLVNKISRAKTPEQKFMLEAKLDYAKKKRALSIKLANAEDTGDVENTHHNSQNDLCYPDELKYELIAEKDKEVNIENGIPRDPVKAHIPPGGLYNQRFELDYEYDRYGPSEFCSCEDICSCAVYEGLRPKEITCEDYISQAFIWHPDKDKIASALKKSLNGQNINSMMVVETACDYYGDIVELEYCGPNDKLMGLINQAYFTVNDAVDPSGGLQYARALGVTTSGKSPYQAIREVISEDKIAKMPQSIQHLIKTSTQIKRTYVQLDEIDIVSSRAKLPSSTPYNYAAAAIEENLDDLPLAGIVINHSNKFILVGAQKSYLAAQRTGASVWPVIELTNPEQRNS